MQLLHRASKRFKGGISGRIKGVEVHRNRIVQAALMKEQLQEAFLLPS